MSWRAQPHCLDSYNNYSDLSYELEVSDHCMEWSIILALFVLQFSQGF